MAEYIYSYQVKPEELSLFIQEKKLPPDSLMLLENLTELKFDFFNEEEKFSSWTRGRLFSESEELKWIKTGSAFTVVYLTGKELSPSEEQTKKKETLSFPGQEEEYFLWGIEAHSKSPYTRREFAFNEYVEKAIPRVLAYPVSGTPAEGSRLKLRVRSYYDEYGSLRFYRFLGVRKEADL